MSLLVAGLAVFFAIHLVPTAPALRARMQAMMGEGGYKLVFSLISVAGLAAVVVGYGAARPVSPDIWYPPAWTRHLTMGLMVIAMILLAAAYVPSRIRDRVRHPMLAAIKTWALAHLLTNGDLASMVLFGSFLGYGVFDRISVKRRGDRGPLGDRQGTARGDVIAIVAGLVVYGLFVARLHEWLIGVPVSP
ncbi:MAG: NnrU family protein [Hyphomicrobiaceae bacterium]